MDYNYNDTTKSRKNKHLNYNERVFIEIRLKDGWSAYKIAKDIGRSLNTIRNEITRGTVEQIKNNKKVQVYYADVGARVYRENRQRSKKTFKYLECIDFINYINDKFKREHWSIDGCIGHSKVNRLFSSNKTICTKTYYNYIELGLLDIKNIDLPLKVKRKNNSNKVKQNKRVLGRSIDERPKFIDNRNAFGHWEIDTVIGRKNKTDKVLLTLLERKTRYLITMDLKDKTEKSVIDAMAKLRKLYGNKFNKVFKTITSDNGSEFSTLSSLENTSKGVKIYFTHPYSSFERGSNERHNGMLRRFIKKGKAISDYDVDYIFQIEHWCNTLPRKILNYNTPDNMFEKELDLIYSI